MGAHASTAMMLAPSLAKRTAWLRPIPRAAPVTNATRPSSSPMCSLLVTLAGLACGGGNNLASARLLA